MPKVKQNTSSKATSAASAKEESAAEAAAKLKVIESSAVKGIKVFAASAEKAQAAEKSYFDCLNWLRDEVEDKGFEQKDTSKLMTTILAKIYCDGDESQVTMEGNSTAYTLRSKYVRLAHPKDAKAAKELNKALDKGVSFAGAYKVATGNATASQTSKTGKHGGARKTGGNTIDDAEELGNQFASLITRALDGGEDYPKYKGGLSPDEIEEAFGQAMAGFRAVLDGDNEEAA